MKKNKVFAVILIAMILSSGMSLAKKNEAQKAREKNLAAVTTFVDINALTRKNNAASKITKLHQMYAKEGYELISVAVYTENGDLQGFFVSYKLKPQ